MAKTFGYFTAVYRDGRIQLGSKSYATGIFAAHLLNQYYRNDTAARLAVYKQYNRKVADTLAKGYISESDYLKAGEEILHILDTLPDLKPFNLLDTDDERSRIRMLFTDEKSELLYRYFKTISAASKLNPDEMALDLLPPEFDEQIYKSGQALLSDVQSTLYFYDTLSDGINEAHKKLLQFVSHLDEAERLDEVHLLPIATEIFGKASFPVKTEYIAVPKKRNSKTIVTARRLCFDSYYSFILTDFFEGLHYGHYPRRCEICGKYFLMQSARHQIYCNGNAPKKYKGQIISCRQQAILNGRKELAKESPVRYRYQCRCSAIRTEKSRGTLAEAQAKCLLELAKKRMQMAMADNEYAKNQYYIDMGKEKLYKDADIKNK